MSQMDNPYADSGAPPRTSGVAVAALVCSLIFCCPLTTILGVVLGIAGFFHAGGPGRRGRGLAVAAILIGIVATVGQYWAYQAFKDTFLMPVFDGPKHVLVAGYAGDNAAAVAALSPTVSVSEAEMAAFIAELRSRYGEFEDVGIDPNAQTQPQPGAPSQVFPYVITFSSGPVNAEVDIIFADQSSGQVIMRPGEIVILDPDRGNLMLPPAPEATSEDSSEDTTEEGDGTGE